MIEILTQTWDGANWINGLFRILYSYDGSGNNVEVLWQIWDGSNWGDIQRDTFSHDGSGNVIEQIFEFWDGTMWVNQTKYNTTWEMTTGIEDVSAIIKDFELYNYPNPFNPSTTIQYTLPSSAEVTLKVYDAMGREVTTLVNKKKSVGIYEVVWDGTDSKGAQVASGVYIYRMNAGNPSAGSPKGQAGGAFIESRKMLLVR